MIEASRPLDPMTLPLMRERLIEASAGTGKTFTIATLYLRLLLGLGGEAAFPHPLSVEEILVVTFTEAATKELRGRIRSNIHQLRLACLRGSSKNAFFQMLLEHIPDHRHAASLLLAAERQMDEAAIFTIHGFCQRMLAQNAFESGVLFEQTLIQDELPLRRQACADFWRRHCYPLPLAIARNVSSIWKGPEALLAELQPYLHGEPPQFSQKVANTALEDRHQEIVDKITAFKQRWLSVVNDVEPLIAASGVDKRSYSSRYLPAWISAVSEWAEQETEEYLFPKELVRFSQSALLEKTKKGEAPEHDIFEEIERLLSEPLTLKDILLSRALSEVRTSIQREKRRRAEIGFDDLLGRLDAALKQPNGQALAESIRARFPVALIDEFQDTDPLQYRIFKTIYHSVQGENQEETRSDNYALLLIGDPKQAIYAFRGADIFTYMQARNEVSERYTLDTNWRSSHGMVAAVNRLFSITEHAFLFTQIPFFPVSAAPENQALRFEYQGEMEKALCFWLQPGEGFGVSEYQQLMAQQCAAQIRDWLEAGQRGTALLHSPKGTRSVTAADITILVRSRAEAALMKDALSALAIPSVYLSNRDSVFTTPEAQELLWLLQAVLAPEREKMLRTALSGSLFGLTAEDIELLNQDEAAWDSVVEEFVHYQQHWKKRGVLPMLREVMINRHLAENMLASSGGERKLTDFLHLGELLQEQSTQLESEHALIRWLMQQLAQPSLSAENQQMRLESDRHLVQIVTVHKSKGLEYNLVCLPFAATFRAQQKALYHDRQTFKAMLDVYDGEEALTLAEEERLAEDLRLLYVALTRAVYHCSVGIAPLFSGMRKKEGVTDVHHSAIGFLVQQKKAGDAGFLATSLQQLADENIDVSTLTTPPVRRWQPPVTDAASLNVRRFERSVYDRWRITSYSGLQQQGTHAVQSLIPNLDSEVSGEEKRPAIEAMSEVPSLHTFPKGAATGTFLHALLENVDFTSPVDVAWLQQQMAFHNIEERWYPVLHSWLETILKTPLDQQGIHLAGLLPQQKCVELQFFLPIHSLLQAQQMDRLIKRYDPLSAVCPPLHFEQVQGMLKGFIDLVFCWQGRYYVLDYKSNWLGPDAESYTQDALALAMCEHRYDLQYQLYTLALHRFLRHRIPDYHYHQHIGGVFYLFLRGMELEKAGQGIFFCRPEEALIEALDRLFEGNNE